MPDPGYTADIFISRRGGTDELVLEVTKTLESDGLKVIVQNHDFANSSLFVADIHKALINAQHFLILWTAEYAASPYTELEYANIIPAIADSQGTRRLGLLRCDASTPDGIFRGRTSARLHNVPDLEARRKNILDVAHGRAPALRPDPAIFGGQMPPRNARFEGRAPELAALHAALSGNGSATITQAAAALHGLGGIGKTTTDAEYLALHANDYDIVWWLLATDPTAIQNGLASLAHKLNPSLPETTPPAEAAAFALATLATRNRPALLVYDNAAGPEDLAPFLPPRGAATLITSRNPDWSEHGTEIPVAPLDEADSVRLLEKSANRAPLQGAANLANTLGRLPLALAQAGAYIRATGITCAQYQARAAELLQSPLKLPAGYPRTVWQTITLAIAEAKSRAQAAETILSRCAAYAPDRIPRLLFEDDTIASESAREAALIALADLSLITQHHEPDIPTISLHRLTHTIAVTHLPAAAEAATRHLADAFPNAFNTPAHWPLCRALLPHAQSHAAYISEGAESEHLAALLDKTGSFLHGSGDLATAASHFRRALEARERTLGPEHPDTLTCLNNLALCLNDSGDIEGAVDLNRRAFEARVRTLGPEHPETLNSLNNLASCLFEQSHLQAAIHLHRRALEVSERTLGPEHPNTLISFTNLAECLRQQGDLQGAAQFHRRGLEARERTLGPEHPDTLISLNNLALCLDAQGDLEGAADLHRRALEAFERTFGAEHPKTIISLHNLAATFLALGDPAAALPLQRRAVAGAERVLGPDHPHTVHFRAQLAAIEPVASP